MFSSNLKRFMVTFGLVAVMMFGTVGTAAAHNSGPPHAHQRCVECYEEPPYKGPSGGPNRGGGIGMRTSDWVLIGLGVLYVVVNPMG